MPSLFFTANRNDGYRTLSPTGLMSYTLPESQPATGNSLTAAPAVADNWPAVKTAMVKIFGKVIGKCKGAEIPGFH